MRRVRPQVSPAAEQDLDEVFHYLANEAGLQVAIRFDDSVQRAFARLAEGPRIGAPQEWRSAELAKVRMWPLPQYPNYLIFYRETSDGIEILRVLHGARDVTRILLEESDLGSSPDPDP